MKPVNIKADDSPEEMRDKLILIVNDIYEKFGNLQNKIIDFNTGKNLTRQISVGVTVDDLDQTISGAYSQSEVQAISDKVDELLVSLRNANIISP